MKLRLTIVTVLSIGAIAAPVSAQTIKPGLWEITSKMAGAADPRMLEMRKAQMANMAAMKKQFDSMPPEQRKSMEAMMAKMGQINQMNEDGGMTAKMCVTPEMANRHTLTAQQREGCTNDRTPLVGGVMKVTFSCIKPKMHGEGTVTLSGDTAYTMDMKMVTEHDGKSMPTSMSTKGKWLGANCGDVKPPQMHPPQMPQHMPPAPK